MFRIFRMIRVLGVRWALFRLRYALKLRSGFFEKKLPCRAWEELSETEIFDAGIFAGTLAADYAEWKRANLRPFLFRAADFRDWRPWLERWSAENAEKEIRNLKAGRVLYFENEYADCGFPPRWRENAVSGKTAPAGTHWSRLGDFGFGDIKFIWEPSRFGFVFPLVRVYARTGDDECARIFWTLFEDWCRENPPETGVNWKCGQEISLRLMAWCFALYAFLESPETTRERLALFVRAVFESARRVRANINYALSQKNNHGVSECVGLICAGTLFPEFRGSAEWLSCGVKNLERQIRELVYPDGGFSQHSLNYHRVMMQDLTFALRISEVNGVELPGILRERLLLAADYARDFVFGNDGDTPCWGANDGAHVFRLSECVYRDFRPHLQCANIGFRRARVFPEGSWDEEALWFFGKPALETVDKEVSPLRKRFSAPVAGTHVLRCGGNAVFFRCGAPAHRPGHDDLLHLDIWRNETCVVGDSGSFSYNSPVPFAAEHNVVSADGLPQMERLSRFLKAPARGTLLRADEHGFSGEHDGYSRLRVPVKHRRDVNVDEDSVSVLDELSSSAKHVYEARWVFPALRIEKADSAELVFLLRNGERCAGKLILKLENAEFLESSIIEGDEKSGEGFVSPHYGERRSAQALSVKFRASSARLRSLFDFSNAAR